MKVSWKECLLVNWNIPAECGIKRIIYSGSEMKLRAGDFCMLVEFKLTLICDGEIADLSAKRKVRSPYIVRNDWPLFLNRRCSHFLEASNHTWA